MSLTDLFGKGNRRCGEALYAALAARAREKAFFLRLGVADTPDGRFDLLALHAFLALGALRDDPVRSQALLDALFRGFEEALRAQGAGDLGMVKKLKALADAFYGRLKAYGEAADEAELSAVLIRNLYRGAPGHEPHAAALARYMTAARARMGGDAPLDFGAVPG